MPTQRRTRTHAPSTQQAEASNTYREAYEAHSRATNALESAAIELAKASCPHKIGDRFTPPRGLGATTALAVMAVQPPKFLSDPERTPRNRWGIVCALVSKTGEVTQRTCTIEEQDVY